MNRLYHICASFLVSWITLGGSAAGEVITVAKPLDNPVVTLQNTDAETPGSNTHSGNSVLKKKNAPSQHPSPAKAEKTIRTRYNDNQLESERDVRLTKSGNYENHGHYKLWDQEGGLVAVGSYDAGVPNGSWKRLYRGQTAHQIMTPDQGHFDLPLVSTFHFSGGLLQGEWKIEDASGRPVRKWNFNDGVLNGEVVVYFSSGNRMRSAKYVQGVPSGIHREWTAEGETVETHSFENGRLKAISSYHWPNGTLKAQGLVLHPRYRLHVEPDWWNGNIDIQTSQPIGEVQKVGDWVYYTADGRTSQTGTYVRGEREGLFSWWYPSGQLQARGHFTGGSPHGDWNWWHKNGALKTSGHYHHGTQAGKWTNWDINGTETEIVNYKAAPESSTIRPPTTKPSTNRIRRRSIDIPLTADRETHRNLKLQSAPKLQ
jgi:antitoxin component YwqK of YwqJK toxin-antitoxin module